MIILGIETSCDETAAAVVRDGHDVLSNVVASQIDDHAPYGGVVPELAARQHLQAVKPVVDQAIAEAGIAIADVDAVAVTRMPGLLPSLLVGVSFAKGLAHSLGKPLIGVNHISAHVFGAFLGHRDRVRAPESYPVLALIVSGGHTLLVMWQGDGASEVVGRTLDDAAGEAFDKGAAILKLPYPGGPEIDHIGASGNPGAVPFPRGLTGAGGKRVRAEDRFNFSFSGVKTSLLTHVKNQPERVQGAEISQDFRDTVASYQEAVVAVLAAKSVAAAEAFEARTLVVCGGVACNRRLRELLHAALPDGAVPELLVAPPQYCTDNAAMIAGLAEYIIAESGPSDLTLDAEPRIGETVPLPRCTIGH